MVSIMVVEDEPLIAENLKQILEQSGHNVVGVAASAPQALRLAAVSPAELALVDVGLARATSGIDACVLLWKQFRIPTLFLTSYCDRTLEVKDTALGCLSKPAGPEEVLSAVAAVKALLAGRTPARVPRNLTLYQDAVPVQEKLRKQ